MAGEGGKAAERIIIPLDVSRMLDAFDLIGILAPYGVWFKIGLEAIMTSLNPESPIVWECIKEIRHLGGKVFFDGKFCDIPHTIAGAAANAAMLGVDAFNVHASAGCDAIKEAVANRGEAEVWVVTLLTSLGYGDLADLGLRPFPCIDRDGIAIPEDNKKDDVGRIVRKMAQLAVDCGCQGVICSGQELLKLGGIPLIKITPGIRRSDAPADDQKRTMTAREAIANGADLVVIGRPITQAYDPIKALLQFAGEIEQGLADFERRGGAA